MDSVANKNTTGGNKTAAAQKKDVPKRNDIGPKQEPEPSVPEHGKELDEAQKQEIKKPKPVGKIKVHPKQLAESEESEMSQITEADIQNIMSQAIEAKKQKKFDAMIDKGAQIAQKQKDEVINKMVENTQK